MKSKILFALVLISLCASCNKYLDIVPDNVATIDHAFRMRATAERYLFTCYSYMPAQGSLAQNAGFASGDEIWFATTASNSLQGWNIARGGQSRVNPIINAWQGTEGSKDVYEGIRTCNIFLENIQKVPDMIQPEKDRWTAEAKFLKAYYHFWLFRQYGPIPLIKENFPVSTTPQEIKQKPRAPVDSCVNFIVQLLDEANIEELPSRIVNESQELGRISRSIVLAVKAQVLVTAASDLFNGNGDYTGFVGADGKPLFNTTFDPAKWTRAKEACADAVNMCETNGYKLNYYLPAISLYNLSDTTKTILGIQNAVSEKWNPEIVWGNTNNMIGDLQSLCTPRGLDPTKKDNVNLKGNVSPTIKIAEMFYTRNGVPIDEDKNWDYSGRYNLRTAVATEKNYIRNGYVTVSMHFDREPRFYADLAFDGGVWYGLGNYDDKKDLLFVSAKKGESASMVVPTNYSITGYWPKKLVNPNNTIGAVGTTTYTIKTYPWPVIRLADLYLLYAEALNEADGPVPEVHNQLNKIRARAGLKTVEESWTMYSTKPGKFGSKDGMRSIIRQERNIEMAFEGQRYWDLRRWKELSKEMNMPVLGWDVEQSAAAAYYRTKTIYIPSFGLKDYLWPIRENEILSAPQLVQNPGW